MDAYIARMQDYKIARKWVQTVRAGTNCWRCLGRVVRTSSTARADALQQPKECFLIGVGKHPDGGREASERETESI